MIYDEENCFKDENGKASCDGIKPPPNKIYCTTPLVPKYGHFQPEKMVYLVGSSIKYTCGDGLEMATVNPDTKVSQCRSDGSWSVLEPPRCNCQHLTQRKGQIEEVMYGAISKGQVDLVECLLDLEEGGERLLLIEDDFGYKPLSWASKLGNLKLVSLLVGRGATFDTHAEKSPVRVAVDHGHQHIVDYLRQVNEERQRL